ncbi:MAG: MMPL family transporter, partial [Planctomycetaceae bacterium]|nr:MMPL family transporter [Planctomycetaceae bacterium]
RRAAAVVIAALGPLLGVVWTLGVMGFAGEELNGIKSVLPTLLFVVAFTDSVHLIENARYFLQRREGSLRAASHALRRVGMACAMTSLTTAVGFGSLIVAETESVRRFGLWCATGALINFVAVILVVPLLLAITPGRFLVRREGTDSPRPSVLALPVTFPDWLKRGAGWISAAGLLLSGVLAWLSLDLEPDMRWLDSIPKSHPTAQVMGRCDSQFGGSLPAFVVIKWPESTDRDSQELFNAVSDVERAINKSQTFGRPVSIVELLRSFTRRDSEDPTEQFSMLERVPKERLDQVVRDDLRETVVTFSVPDLGAGRLNPAYDEMDRELAQLKSRYKGMDFHLTGTTVIAGRNVNHMVGDLARSLFTAGVIVFGLMTVLFRSFVLGLLSILPNMFPLVFISGFLVLTGQSLDLFNMYTFSLCLGLTVDDTIHFLMRFRQELQIA